MTFTLTIISRLFFTLLLDLLYAPIWWFTGGIIWILKSVGGSIRNTAESAGLGLWLRNIFVPMYGQYDIWGRIISFMMRLVNIIARSVWVLIWTVICLAVVTLWIIGPVIVVYELATSSLLTFSRV